jgi:uncharacterized caspase-like protein
MVMRSARVLSIVSACVILAAGMALHLHAASAQQPDAAQPENRIALVIGNGAYTKDPLATAANDAGLIAQTLQAAGFDVVGARDLDGDMLRSTLRDFLKKAETSGPDTVAVVYLSGYGLQYAGENYFIPVDTTIARDTDIPIEGLRVGDYIRQLAALPLKAGVAVLDIAREQPFLDDAKQIASGLALIEPDPHMLIAFNAAPGTVAPSEPGPYGAYAQALAEMIRTGGLSLPDLFDRVRLRVNETSKGAQVPWDTQKIDASFKFFDRAPDAPPDPSADQTAAAQDKPIRDLSAQDAYSAALRRDTLQDYEDFLGAFPQDPMAKRVRAIAAARREAITWRRTYRAATPDSYWSYLRRYPNGPHAADARRRLAILAASLEPPASFSELDYDVPPPPPEEIIYVDRPVLMFSDPEFDFAPPPPPPVFFLPPPPPDFIDLETPEAPDGVFMLPQPIFIPVPIYVRPPPRLRPPPNNLIFGNIHNAAAINALINRRAGGAGPIDRSRQAGTPPGAVRAGVGPALPAAVAQRSNLIQQGRATLPVSATIDPADKTRFPGRTGRGPRPPGVAPVTISPTTAPAAIGARPAQPPPIAAPPGPGLPRASSLPLPGGNKLPPPPVGARTGQAPVPPTVASPPPGRRNIGANPPPTQMPSRVAPVRTAPSPGIAPRREPPPRQAAPPRVAPRAMPPRPAPVVRAAPPRPAPRMAAPPRPAPVMRAAPPRPAPVMRAAPPPRPAPVMRAAPPPRPAPVVRAPPPPPAPRAAPPPRPAPAAAKKCPPNQPRC